MKPLPRLTDDGLVTPEVGAWAEEKYQLVLCYATIVARSMAKKAWQGLVYLDLFAGAGRARIAGTQQIIPASPLLVLGLQNGFGTHIFCELDPANAEALRTRTAEAAAGRRVVVVEWDTNANVDAILNHVPERSLTFCFVDPFAIAPLQFTTIRRLADARRMDFLVLLATGMDVTRNERLYTLLEDLRVSEAVGHDNWRASWPQPRTGLVTSLPTSSAVRWRAWATITPVSRTPRRSITGRTPPSTGSRSSAGIPSEMISGRSADGRLIRTGASSEGKQW
jgi:three-Cys-motif partner protein